MSEIAVPPSEIIRETFAEQGLTQTAAARRLGVSTPRVCRIVSGSTGIGPRTALQLEFVTNVSASFWMALQANYELAQERPLFESELRARATS